MIKLTNENSKIAADSLCALLTENHIDSFIQAPNIGGISNILSGQSIYGYDIYVNEEDYSLAKQILADLNLYQEKSTLSQEDIAFMKETKTSIKQQHRLRKSFICINIAIIIILILIAFVTNHILN